MPLGLAVDLSSPTGTFCLFEKGATFEIRHETTLPGTFSHSESLLAEISLALNKNTLLASDIRFWVMGTGPGSFTGLRIAYATIKAFSLATGSQVLTVEGPEARALGFLKEIRTEKPTGSIVVLSHLTVEKLTVTTFNYGPNGLEKRAESVIADSLLDLEPGAIILSEKRISRERFRTNQTIYDFPLSARHLRFSGELKSCRYLTPEEVLTASPFYFGSSHFD
jgi:tRNA threonylcarbamoyl adenosine modification protein YeaZ